MQQKKKKKTKKKRAVSLHLLARFIMDQVCPGLCSQWFHAYTFTVPRRASFAVNSHRSSGYTYAGWVKFIPFFILEPITVARQVALVLISLSQCHMIILGVRCTQTMSIKVGWGSLPRNMGFCNKKGEKEVLGREKQ